MKDYDDIEVELVALFRALENPREGYKLRKNKQGRHANSKNSR